MQRTDEESMQYNIQVLRRLSVLQTFPEEVLLKMSDLINVVRKRYIYI